MIVSIIVEGEDDKMLLEAVLRPAVAGPSFEVVSSGNRSSAISLARSYLTLPDRREALVLDSETNAPRQVQEQHSILDDLLGAVAPHWRFGVFLAVPELESCFFASPTLAAAVFGRPVAPEEMVRGRFEPKAMATDLLGGGSPAAYNQELQQVLKRTPVLNFLGTVSPFHELRRFIEEAPRAEWIARGFRWPGKAILKLPDHSTITIEPSMHRSSLQKNVKTDRQASTLRFYRVTDEVGNAVGEKSELDLTEMLGNQ